MMRRWFRRRRTRRPVVDETRDWMRAEIERWRAELNPDGMS